MKKESSTDDDNGITFNKRYHKVRDHSHYTEKYRATVHDVCNLRCTTLKETSVVFHNGSTDNYFFIIKGLA